MELVIQWFSEHEVTGATVVVNEVEGSVEDTSVEDDSVEVNGQ